MIGLRAQAKGKAPVVMALSQKQYMVAAGVSWRREERARRDTITVDGTGIDDRKDHLRWFLVADSGHRSWLDVMIVDASVADSPRRKARREIDWLARYRNDRARERRRITELIGRLREIGTGKVLAGSTALSPVKPAVGFQVSVNGDLLGRAGVGDPGTLSVTVFLKQRGDVATAQLTVHGGDNLGDSWHWRTWSWESQKLQLGDEVRIEAVEPTGLDLGRVRQIENYEPRTAEEIQAELDSLRQSVREDIRAQAAKAKADDDGRPAPRHYPRSGR